jgi:hypothetical protein
MNSNNVKKTTNQTTAGQALGYGSLRGVCSDDNIRQLRANPKLRSPFRFGGGSGQKSPPVFPK